MAAIVVALGALLCVCLSTAPRSCRTLLAQFSGKARVEVLFTSLTYKKNPGPTQAVGARGLLRQPRHELSAPSRSKPDAGVAEKSPPDEPVFPNPDETLTNLFNCLSNRDKSGGRQSGLALACTEFPTVMTLPEFPTGGKGKDTKFLRGPTGNAADAHPRRARSESARTPCASTIMPAFCRSTHARSKPTPRPTAFHARARRRAHPRHNLE